MGILSVSECNTRVTKPVSGPDWDVDLSDEMKKKCMYLGIGRWDQEVTTMRWRKRH